MSFALLESMKTALEQQIEDYKRAQQASAQKSKEMIEALFNNFEAMIEELERSI